MTRIACRCLSTFLRDTEHVPYSAQDLAESDPLTKANPPVLRKPALLGPTTEFSSQPHFTAQIRDHLYVSAPAYGPRPRSPLIPSKARIKASGHELKTSAHAKGWGNGTILGAQGVDTLPRPQPAAMKSGTGSPSGHREQTACQTGGSG